VRRRRLLFEAFLIGATILGLAFLLLPLVAIFLRVPLGEFVAQLHSDVAIDALLVTLETNAVAQALIVLVGTPTAYLLATRRFRWRALAITLVELPLVLPPAVAGLALLAAFGRLGLLGGTFEALGVTVSFTKTAVVLAVAYVASPFYVRGAIAAFEALDQPLLDASRTLGAGPARTFFRVALPLAAQGLVAAAALSIARGLGEFGATITFVSNIPGETQTIPIAIYGLLQSPSGDVAAMRLSLLSIALSLGALLASDFIARRLAVAEKHHDL
jgi:molybdate transport system permease protein